jgi:HEPN/RES N-terminal domain 1/RES domain
MVAIHMLGVNRDFPGDPDLCVCADCVGDQGLKDFVAAHANTAECSFCGAKSKDDIAAPLDELVEHMLSCLARDYDDPDNAGMVYESAEGGYQGQVWDTYDFLQGKLALELPKDNDNSLFDAICEGLGSQLWCTRHLYSLGPDAALAYSWETFCRIVKHESRFFFTQVRRNLDDRELLPPGDLLKLIARYAVAAELVRKMPAGQIFYRVRIQESGVTLSRPSELGPPLPEIAKQNRMSPAGIVMTYVSEDTATALDETADKPGTYAIGRFRTLRDITILDLAQLPAIPSLFAEIPDTLEYDPHEALIFLHALAEDISRPIARDDRIHIEYVPTQVVTEFLRTAKLPDKQKLDGIRYRSSRRNGGTSLVLFADQHNVLGAWDKPWPKPDAWLELVGRTEHVVS